MSTALSPTRAKRHQLEASLPDWCALQWHHTLLSTLFVLGFLYFCYVPVSSPLTWGSIADGEALSRSEITRFPLAEGMRHAQVGELGHRVLAHLHAWGGPGLISLSFAVVQTCSLILWSVVFVRCARHWSAALMAFVPVVCNLSRLDGLHPLTMAPFFLGVLVFLILPANDVLHCNWAKAPWWRWLGAVVLFAAWVNVHVSFVVGLVWLVGWAAARAVETSMSGGMVDLWHDREFQRRVWLAELATLATCLNPQGWKLWQTAWWWPGNPILEGLGGWSPAAMASSAGLLVACSWFAGAVFARRLPRMPVFWMTTGILGTLGVACSATQLLWGAPLLILAVLATWGSSERTAGCQPVVVPPTDVARGGLRFTFTLLTGLVLWSGFSFSPLGSVLGGQGRTPEQILGKNMPLGARNFLVQHAPLGLIHTPAYWTGYLGQGTPMTFMLGGTDQRVPAMVTADCEHILRGGAEWERLARKYALTLLVIDKGQQDLLARKIRRGAADWQIAYEDSQTLIVTKKGAARHHE
ncbi:MAG: hypothetical protein KDA60_13780 [Planctomycetales bacterium]|nr:hypothetical protein [Planctomycetales bacterium]